MAALTQRLDLRQSQSLVMTPQLQQAIKLLQLSNIEVAAYVEQELEQNPLLERDDSGGDEAPAEPAGGDGDLPARDHEAPLLDSADGSAPAAASEAPLDTDSVNMWDGDSASALGTWGSGGRRDFDDPDFNLGDTLTRELSLRDHLLAQINVDIADPVDRIIGSQLVDHLDESGWFSGDVETIANGLKCEPARVEATLTALQRLDPPGIFARSLKECLALQLRDRNRLDPAMTALLDNLELLAKREHAQLMKLCGVDAEDFAEMVSEIKALDPKPGLVFEGSVAQTVVPDVLVRPVPGGGWAIELNQDTLPRVLVNQRYYTQVTKELRKKADRDFLTERFHSANWLVKSLHQRAQTILKVATEIVRQQDAFFRHGVQHLRPLVLRDIATAIEMHESTVSRVTSNKFLAAPGGLYELKYFFTSAIQNSDGGEAHSAEAVRFRIKTLIDGEPADDVLSDDKLVEMLRKDGVDIARRTVAKYREALRIPSSVQRRRDKSLGVR
ncbi:MAG: RNA polymerase factor sigma-54 [Alphaproteobacteria bacterium]|nr:RNA polymerase factor sigma-54 [Alphaproteobacteria bacterium]